MVDGGPLVPEGSGASSVDPSALCWGEGHANISNSYGPFLRAIMVARARVTRALTDLQCTPRPAQMEYSRQWAYVRSITDLMAL